MSDSKPDSQEMRRKLTTLLHADVYGYSRLMGQNEMATLKILKDYKSVVGDLLQQHHGRTVNWTGDGLLAEFDSVVEAVSCAAEIQAALCARNDQLPEDERMDFRVGINLGDVMVDGQELFGEGVNIAARLQSIAPVGGVLISGTAFDQVQGKLKYDFDFVGRQRVKNIAAEVPAYGLVVNPDSKDKSKRLTRCKDPGPAYRTSGALPLAAHAPTLPEKQSGREIYAGFWRRLIAFSIDWSIVIVTCILIGDLTGLGWITALSVIIYILYMGAMESSIWQASLGKKVMGIRVLDENGETMPIQRAVSRNAAKLISVATLLVGFVMAAFTERRQALHDKMADAVLINEDALALRQGRPQKIWT